MIPGISGSLLSHEALTHAVREALAPHLDAGGAADARRAVAAIVSQAAAGMGPSSAARAVFDGMASRLAAVFGFAVALSGRVQPGPLRAVLASQGHACAGLIATDWGRDPSSAWRDAVHHGIATGVRWCFCFTGPSLRVIDTTRSYSRRHVQFDLEAVAADSAAFALAWGLLRADAFNQPGGVPLLDRAVALSEEYRAGVRASLQVGVRDALACLLRAFAAARRPRRCAQVPPGDVFDESLTVIYRVLFLLFAEARGLVPQWHPVYRESYTIEALRPAVERSARPPGLWDALQAISRLAHRGCHAGELVVPPFNGRLFSPAHAPLADAARLDDGAVREAMLALTTRSASSGRLRISYADLGVEQLGGVYERLLDVEAGGGGSGALVRSNRRKATGSFYTPRTLTEYLVRRTLAPLVESRPPEGILAIRVLDPAMGSGAFLVAACRYMAAAYESALVREGAVSERDVTDGERAEFRRAIAQRCLYGVDINPMAVQLGRLSLWLATLARDKPLTFLDHHLRSGNSLAGASLADVMRRPPAGRRSGARAGSLPLFGLDECDGDISAAVGPRVAIASDPGDTLEQIRAKERALAAVTSPASPIARWKTVADLWCAAWFEPAPAPRGGAAFAALADAVLDRRVTLPPHVAGPLLEGAKSTAGRERFFHWTLEFPEVFYSPEGHPLAEGGFDAVVGNPPWEMLRGDSGDRDARNCASAASSKLTAFTRTSGVYAWQGDGHANLYQLFLERSLVLTRRGGRLGLVLPSGFATDHGCAGLRRAVMDRLDIDTCVSIENRDGLFPIHRGLRFLLLGGTAGAPTSSLPYRAGVRSPEALDQLSDTGRDPASQPLSRDLLARTSGTQVSIPDIRSGADLSLVSRLAYAVPALGDEAGWGAAFGRELNATDDRRHFEEGTPARAGLLPVVEGKQIRPFAVDLSAVRYRIPAARAAALLDPARTFGRPRLAYRDVASATNRLTLIAAIVPEGCVTTHTLFCLRTLIEEDERHLLCALMNSYVANYLVRLRVTTHVTASIVERVPVPRPPRDSDAFRELAALGRALTRDPGDPERAALLQARTARLYGLAREEFVHVLATLPLVPDTARDEALRAFTI